MDIKIESPNENEFILIKHYAKGCNLDTRDMKKEHFIAAKINGELVGFGRVKQYESVSEIGTFGVAPKYRDRGIGQKIVTKLISMATDELYIITTIPSYCYRFGFDLTYIAPKPIISSYYAYKSICKQEVYILKKKKIIKTD